MAESFFLGVDSGANGAAVVLDSEGRYVDCLMHHGNSPVTISTWLREIEHGIKFAALEQVNSFQHDGHVGAFSFGTGYGLWLMGLAQMPHCLVVPKVWQAACSLQFPAPLPMPEDQKARKSVKDKNKRARNKATADQARRRWPTIPIRIVKDFDVAAAAFLADYARLRYSGAALPKETRSPRKQEIA